MRFTPIFPLAAALLVVGCNDQKAGTPASDAVDANSVTVDVMQNSPEAAPDAMGATDTTTYLAMAGAGDLFEVESSKAIAAKTKNESVRKFAEMMVADHGKSTAKVKAAAEAGGLTVAPPKLMPAQQTLLDEIKAADGTAADTAYIAAQRTAHADALTLHRDYAAKGDKAELKAVAAEIAPVVQHHIEELGRLKAE